MTLFSKELAGPKVLLYQNERRPAVMMPFSGNCLRFSDRAGWTTFSDLRRCTQEQVRLPGRNWRWSSEWQAARTRSSRTDSEGWEYAVRFGGARQAWHASAGLTNLVRRRLWVRCMVQFEESPEQVVQGELNSAGAPMRRGTGSASLTFYCGRKRSSAGCGPANGLQCADCQSSGLGKPWPYAGFFEDSESIVFRSTLAGHGTESKSTAASVLKFPRVKAATSQMLIKRLTHEVYVDDAFNHAFMLNYRRLWTPSQLLLELKRRYHDLPPTWTQDHEGEIRRRFEDMAVNCVKERVASAIKTWLQMCSTDFVFEQRRKSTQRTEMVIDEELVTLFKAVIRETFEADKDVYLAPNYTAEHLGAELLSLLDAKLKAPRYRLLLSIFAFCFPRDLGLAPVISSAPLRNVLADLPICEQGPGVAHAASAREAGVSRQWRDHLEDGHADGATLHYQTCRERVCRSVSASVTFCFRRAADAARIRAV